MPHTDNTTAPAVTMAGAQMNTCWPDLERAIAEFVRHLTWVGESAWDRVVFRCGTVVRVRAEDPEFEGFTGQEHAEVFPAESAPAEVLEAIRDDHRLVWEVQRAIPGAAGRAIRRGYAKLLGEGYPFPGPTAERRGAPIGDHVGDSGRALWLVKWPRFSPGHDVTNLLFTNPTLGVAAAGDLRRNDFLFPEVAAVIAGDRRLWAYGPDGVFGEQRGPSD